MSLTPEALERIAWAIFDAHRDGTAKLTLKAGSITGQVAADPAQPLSTKQLAWLASLAERAGVPFTNDGETGDA